MVNEIINGHYQIAYTCTKCKKMFTCLSTVKQDINYFVNGLVCNNCSRQDTLDTLDFEV